LELEFGLGLEEIRFRSNVFSSKCNRSEIYTSGRPLVQVSF